MRNGFGLGRVAGVRVGVDWSVLAIFLLITIGLGAGQFPDAYPGRSAAAYTAAALIAGVVFLASLLAHEIAHAVVAQRCGLTVEGITLWMLGGVARIQGEAPSPAAETRIAGVGPATSALLAVVFGGVAVLLDAVGVHGLPLGVFAWLAGINAMLAVFNVIPAAPLDGGRLLRAFLWWRRGDRLAASVTASRAGRVLGYVLVVVGFAELFAGAGIGGLWLALIGLFLISAATGEERQAIARELLTGVRASEVMSPDPVAVPAETTVDVFLDRYVFAHRHSTFPVVDSDGRPVGLVTLNRVKDVPPERRALVRLREVACPIEQVPVASPGEAVADLLPRLASCTDGRALVLDRGVLVGIISPSDVTRALERIRARSGYWSAPPR
jgi:Zn-dependent protease/predicted transcriptional regulator